jgi:hypothetical protein
LPLPGIENATIEDSKVRDYLLSTSHPVGRFKARFFLALGYSRRDWGRLRTDLLRLAREGEIHEGQPSEYGEKYEIRGKLEGPAGTASVVTIRILLHGEDVPRFITAFPGDVQ